MSHLDKFLMAGIDAIDQGLIVIDRKGLIKVYNQKAARIFGIDPRIGPGHEEGTIQNGDIVVISDNCLGKDDGNLKPDDLRKIGVDPEGIAAGDAVVAIGVMGARAGTTCFKTAKTKNAPLSISKTMNGVFIEAFIDFNEKRLGIRANDHCFDFFYSIAAGHAVILSGKSLKIKFYQTRGYTARKEDIKSILNGKRYTRKGPDAEIPKMYDRHISIFHPDSDIIDRLTQVAAGRAPKVILKESIINGIPVRCSILPIEDSGSVTGALLKVEDIRELKILMLERDKAIESIQHLERQLERTRVQREAFKHIIGVSQKLQDAVNLACRASESDSTVLLLGESGTGKNLFAKAIHQSSSRRDGPFVYINCTSIPENLFESELFGYERGAFTGALSSGKPGLLERAHGGTVFLDEIAELPLTMQAKVLHFLQTRSFTRVGGLNPFTIDVRIICATNKNLEELVAQNIFREDLYYRINVFPITIPPLRERPEDISHLVRFLVPKLCEKLKRGPKHVNEDVMRLLKLYSWKGNVRELENVLERAINVCEGNTITVNDLPEGFKKMAGVDQLVSVIRIGPLKKAVEQTERQLISKILDYTGGCRKEAIKTLGIGKTSFYQKVKKYRIK